MMRVRLVRRSYGRFLAEIDACRRLAADPAACELCAPNVSKWSVAEQLEHLLRADRGVLGVLEKIELDAADPVPGQAPEAGRPSLLGRIVLFTGYILRGRGQAPASTAPQGMSCRELQAGFEELKDRSTALGPRLAVLATSHRRTPHPILGAFTPGQWLRFLAVHHRHHARIIRDIREAASPRD